MLSCSPSASQNVKYEAGTLVLHSPLVGLPACIPMTVNRPVSFVPGVDCTRTFAFHSVVTVVDTMGSVAHNTPPRDPQTL